MWGEVLTRLLNECLVRNQKEREPGMRQEFSGSKRKLLVSAGYPTKNKE
jgi:hypothetical protein